MQETSGSQQFAGVKGDFISRAESGNIKIQNTKGKLLVETSYGNIKGSKILLKSSAIFKTTSGKSTRNLLNELKDLRFDLSSGSGKLCVEKKQSQ